MKKPTKQITIQAHYSDSYIDPLSVESFSDAFDQLMELEVLSEYRNCPEVQKLSVKDVRLDLECEDSYYVIGVFYISITLDNPFYEEEIKKYNKYVADKRKETRRKNKEKKAAKDAKDRLLYEKLKEKFKDE